MTKNTMENINRLSRVGLFLIVVGLGIVIVQALNLGNLFGVEAMLRDLGLVLIGVAVQLLGIGVILAGKG